MRNNYFSLSEDDQRRVLQQASAKYGLPPQAIEKDLWVSTILQRVHFKKWINLKVQHLFVL